MKKTAPHLLDRARVLRLDGLSFREIAKRLPGLSSSVAHRAARNVPILKRKGNGWPDRRGWVEGRPLPASPALVHRIMGTGR